MNKPSSVLSRLVHWIPRILGVLTLLLLLLAFIPKDVIEGVITRLLNKQGKLNASFDLLFPLFQFRLRVLAGVLALIALFCWRSKDLVQHWFEQVFPPLWLRLRSGPGFGDPVSLFTLAALVLGGFLLRFHFLFDPIGFDESDSIMSYGARPLIVGLSWYSQPNNHIFHTLWVHFCWMLFGSWEWAIRLPALVAGLVLIPVSYAMGKQFYDRRTGLIAAALVTSAPWMVLYSVESRGYTIVCVLTCLLLIASRSLLRRDDWSIWFCWTAAIALGFYTIPTFLFPASGAALWLVCGAMDLKPDARGTFLLRLGISTGLSALLTALLYMPVLLVMGTAPLFSNPYVLPRGLNYVFSNGPKSLGDLGHYLTGDYPGAITALLGLCLAAGLAFRFRGNGYRLPLLLAIIPMGLLLVFARRVVPYTRVWTYLTPILAVSTAAGLTYLLGRMSASLRVWAALSLFLAALLGYFVWRGNTVPSRSSHPGVENIAVWLQANLRPGDVVTTERTALAPLTYYLRRHGYRGEIKLAPCDPVTVYYQDFSAPLSGRVFTVLADGGQTQEKVLSTACLEQVPGHSSIKRYQRPGMSIVEIPETKALSYRPTPSSPLE